MNDPEFNNGFITSLGLFYGHLHEIQRTTQLYKQIDMESRYDLVLYGASDHLYDIQYPENISKELKEEIEAFVDWVFSFRLGNPTREQVEAVFERCKDLFVKIDKEFFGLEAVVNYW